MKAKSVVWLTHLEACNESDPFEQACRQAGWVPVAAPLIQVRDLGPLAVVAAVKPAMPAAGAVIFTSPRAVTALEHSLETESELASKLKGLPCYSLSGATARRAVELGWTPADTKSGSALELAQALLPLKLKGRLLFFCGSLRREELPGTLRAAGFEVQEIAVYTTASPRGEDLDALRTKWRDEPPDCAVFFSPSGVKTATAHLGDLAWKDIMRIALGPTTAGALTEAGLGPHAVLREPNAMFLKLVLDEAAHGRQKIQE